jgi:hypothetical protein
MTCDVTNDDEPNHHMFHFSSDSGSQTTQIMRWRPLSLKKTAQLTNIQ